MTKREQAENGSTGGSPQDPNEPSPSAEVQRTLPFGLDAFLTEPRLMPGESPKEYEAIRSSLLEQIKPRDAVEAMWTNDIVDLAWEARRYKALRDHALRHAFIKVAADFAFGVYEAGAVPGGRPPCRSSADRMALEWSKGTKQGQMVNEFLEGRGLAVNDLAAKAAEEGLPVLDRLNRLVVMADRRRDSLLREIERKREIARRQNQSDAAEVVDVEVTTPGTPFGTDR